MCTPTIGLMRHITKLRSMILINKALHSCRIRVEIGKEQYSFVQYTGMRNTIFMIKILSEQQQKCRNIYTYIL